jgi:uncharacterized protein YycO
VTRTALRVAVAIFAAAATMFSVSVVDAQAATHRSAASIRKSNVKAAAKAVSRDQAKQKKAAKAKSKKIHKDKKKPSSNLGALGAAGDYPTRAGVILVTSDAYKGLIPTGHAAIVVNASLVVEAMPNGVVFGPNAWQGKGQAYAVTARTTTYAQDAQAAQWAIGKIGRPYNYDYWNTATRTKFYCSQLVWAAFKDNFKIDLNTSAYNFWGFRAVCTKYTICTAFPKHYNPVHPLELVTNNKVFMIWRNK